MKKVILCLLTVTALLFGCLALSSCTTINPPSGNNGNAQIMAIYDLYVNNAEAKGETPLSYEDWLAQIKGEKGDKGDNGKSAYEIWLELGNEGTEADFLNWLKGLNDHNFGEWIVFSDEGVDCSKKLYYRICSDCNKAEWKQGSFSDHDWAEEYSSDDDYHWHECALCNAINEKEAHTEGVYGNCTVCNPILPTDGILYEENGTYAAVVGYEGSSSEVVIADTYNGMPVTEISERAFFQKSITSVIISDSVTSIGRAAFYICRRLTSIEVSQNNNTYKSVNGILYTKDGATLVQYPIGKKDTSFVVPDSVTSIGEKAFYECDSLTNVEIGDSVTSIGNYAFGYCSSLTSVVIGDSVTSIGSCVFYECSSLTSVVIGDSVTSIGSYAFYNCSSLTSVEIPDSVTSIGSYAFYNCSSLTSVEIPDSITSIGSYAFSSCSSLTSIEIPDSVTSIGSYAFYNCSSLTSVVIGDSVTSIGSYAFSSCSSLTSVTLGKGITSMRANAFESTKITYNIYEGVRYLGTVDNPYYYLMDVESKNYTSYTIHPDTKVIINYAFYECKRLASITIPDSVTSIGSEAFYDCSSLTSIEISDLANWCQIDGLGEIVSYNRTLYLNGEELSGEIVIPNTVTEIKPYAFRYCDKITSIEIPDSVTSIGSWAFGGCSSLTSIEIPDSVTSIGSSAFNGCTSLTNIEIPDSVTSIGDYAFYYCGRLTSIEVNPNNSSYKSVNGILYTKDGTTLVQYPIGKKDTSFIVPGSVTSIGDYSFYSCDSLTSVVIGDSVTSIGSFAFAYCSSLTSVTLGKGITSMYANSFSGTKITYNIYEGVRYLGTVDNPYYYLMDVESKNYTSYAIHPDTKVIINYAFEDCKRLASITIPDSVTSIGEYAFRNCSSLTSVVIGDSVTSIGKYAFFNCISLTSVVIGDSVTSIGYAAFANCSSLKTVYYNGTAEKWADISIGDVNYDLTNSTKYYYIENEEDVPTDGGNYWHYDENGEIAIW